MIPSTPGVLSAFGFLVADVQNEFARTYLQVMEDISTEDLSARLDELRQEAHNWLEREGVPDSQRAFEFFADCRYYMQDIQIPCALDPSAVNNGFAATIRGQFEDEHRRRYGFDLDASIEIATLRVVGVGTSTEEVVSADATPTAVAARPQREEQVYFDGQWEATGIHDRDALNAGSTVAGPAVVVQEDTTTVIEPGYNGVIDSLGNLVIREGEGKR